MTAYYNEIDPFAAQWLRNLIAAGHIAPGDVDERSIEDVHPDELEGYDQCHFFAGIGVWSLALRNAGWPDDQPVWTGSCPCQPFSSAGKRGGTADERHLWPAWHHLIGECGPPVIFGEQVASKDGLGWLDLVQADLEAAGYASGAVDLCAAGVGAPHIRQRLWFVAERLDNEFGHRRSTRRRDNGQDDRQFVDPTGGSHRLADSEGGRRRQGIQGRGESDRPSVRTARERSEGLCASDRLADLHVDGRVEAGRSVSPEERDGVVGDDGVAARQSEPGPTNGHWRDADWLYCRDGKWRPIEPGTLPLADGIAGRVGQLRAYGNAIVEPAARTFIAAYMDGRAAHA